MAPLEPPRFSAGEVQAEDNVFSLLAYFGAWRCAEARAGVEQRRA